jgi:hypothetical protein
VLQEVFCIPFLSRKMQLMIQKAVEKIIEKQYDMHFSKRKKQPLT